MIEKYHADISNGFNVRVYSTEPPEDLVVRLGHFLLLENITSSHIMSYVFKCDYIKMTKMSFKKLLKS